MEKYNLLNQIKDILLKNKLTLSTAESCTGGLISSYLTDISGASEYIFQNFVTYSNEAKQKYLNVNKDTLDKFGAVSRQTANEMVLGLLRYGNCAIITTGILGPTGGSKEKPIGLVYIGLGCIDKIKIVEYISKKSNTNNRYEIKKDMVEQALYEFLNFLKNTLN